MNMIDNVSESLFKEEENNNLKFYKERYDAMLWCLKKTGSIVFSLQYDNVESVVLETVEAYRKHLSKESDKTS